MGGCPACPHPASAQPARVWRSMASCGGRDLPLAGPSPQTCSRHHGPDSASGNTLPIKSRSPERKRGVTQHLVPLPQPIPRVVPASQVRTGSLPAGTHEEGQGGDGATRTWEGDRGRPQDPCLQMGVLPCPRASETTWGTGDLPAACSGFQVAHAEGAKSRRGGPVEDWNSRL